MERVMLDIVSEGVGRLILNNPPLNLVTIELAHELDAVLTEVERDPRIRALIIQGAGNKAFSAGSDIKEFPSILETVVEHKLYNENVVFEKIASMSMPTIALIQGLALGGGCEIALACDLRVMAKNAKIGLPEINLGWFPGSGGLYRLPKLVGSAVAKELMFLGELISAEEAYRVGLVNRIVEPDSIVESTQELVEHIASKSISALKAIKKGVDRSGNASWDEILQLNMDLCRDVFRTPDAKEGIRAFFAKEKPKFNNGGI